MNGKKVLNELIRLFLIANIILVIINCSLRGNQHILSGERIDNVARLLEKDGISIETEMIKSFAPKYSANLIFVGDSVGVRDKVVKNFFGNSLSSVKRSTSASKNHINGNASYYTLDNETLIFDHNELTYINQAVRTYTARPSLDQARNMCMKLLKRIDETKHNTSYKMVEEEYDHYWKLIYFPVIEGIPVIDSYMEFEVYDDGVAKANLKLANIEIDSDGKQDIYAIDLVLFGIADDMIEKGYTTVEEITMCYKCTEIEENVLGQKAIPLYKIKIRGLEEPIFVNAYTNEIVE